MDVSAAGGSEVVTATELDKLLAAYRITRARRQPDEARAPFYGTDDPEADRRALIRVTRSLRRRRRGEGQHRRAPRGRAIRRRGSRRTTAARGPPGDDDPHELPSSALAHPVRCAAYCGLITRRQVFWTRAEALQAAGLRD